MVSDIVTINGAQLYYEVKGSGAALLLVHAGVADCRMWDAQFDVFAEQFRVIRFDMRGFGRSNMPVGTFCNHEDVRGLLNFLEIESAHILGISFGGLIALDFALAYPAYVKTLILAATSVSGALPSDRIRQFWEEEEAMMEKGDLEGATELNLQLWVDGPKREVGVVDVTVRQKVYQMQLAIFQKEIPDNIDEIGLDPPAIDRLNQLKMPVQLIVGDLDLEEKVALTNQLAVEIPQAKKVILPDVAHMLNMEVPETFNQYVLEFLLQ